MNACLGCQVVWGGGGVASHVICCVRRSVDSIAANNHTHKTMASILACMGKCFFFSMGGGGGGEEDREDIVSHFIML